MTDLLIFILGWTCAICAPVSLYLMLVPDGRRGMSLTNMAAWLVRIVLTFGFLLVSIAALASIASVAAAPIGVIGWVVYATLYSKFINWHDRRRGREERPEVAERVINNYYARNLNPYGQDRYYSDPGNATHAHSEGRSESPDRMTGRYA